MGLRTGREKHACNRKGLFGLARPEETLDKELQCQHVYPSFPLLLGAMATLFGFSFKKQNNMNISRLPLD